ncbi:3-methyl-2-oxobutanoate dehydrogenase lipoamide kinase [Ceratocystis lukuohia]|uniref:Protein-serine/threonine kinase n=1 Tax=Ceratocystis lukuohia TaxID=2019550 RepID=A0ABR4MU39_9PEZI
MPSYLVTFKEDSTKDQIDAAKKLVKDQGGEITDEFSLIKGFTVSYPEGTVQTLSKDPNVSSFQLNGEEHPHQHVPFHSHGRPPLSEEALLASANFALELLPVRLAHRIQALRSLPFIVVSNPHIKKIYQNYMHSYETLLPFARAAKVNGSSTSAKSHLSPYHSYKITSLADETRFTAVLSDLVAAHQDTIPVLARGFLECKRYIAPDHVTRFLDQHLRARIGTRLLAEQHLALHYSSHPLTTSGGSHARYANPPAHYVGVIDTALQPAECVEICASLVADMCELRYGVRPALEIDGDHSATFAYVPMHLDYMLTELLKNAFRATVESRSDAPVVVTVAPEPAVSEEIAKPTPANQTKADGQAGAIVRLDDKAPGVTIRIRDQGGGIAPDVLPNIWSYSFTTVAEDDGSEAIGVSGAVDAGLGLGLAGVSPAGSGASSLAGLGYGLPLSRAYAEYFGGSLRVESLYGWGTDVYLRIKGIGKV